MTTLTPDTKYLGSGPVPQQEDTQKVAAPDPAALLLDQAKDIVTGPRRLSYGTPEDNFVCIAGLWDKYLKRREVASGGGGFNLRASDVAVMMILMKAARLAAAPSHGDSWRDIAGYAACGARASKADLS